MNHHFYKIKRDPLRDPANSVPKETGGKVAATQPAGSAGKRANFFAPGAVYPMMIIGRCGKGIGYSSLDVSLKSVP